VIATEGNRQATAITPAMSNKKIGLSRFMVFDFNFNG
jgi:hypothetical protein